MNLKIYIYSDSHLASSQVADLSELWCADPSDGDHYVSIRNLSITLIIWVKEMIQFVSNCQSLSCIV